MSGAILQIVCQGADDLFLTNLPEISLFRTVFRKHTNFCRTQQELHFPNELTFGKEGELILRKLTDLMNRIFLIIELPQVEIYYEKLRLCILRDIFSDVNMSDLFDNYSDDYILSYDDYIKLIPIIEKNIACYSHLLDVIDNIILEINTTEKKIDITKYLDNPEIKLPNKNYPLLGKRYHVFSKILKFKSLTDPIFIPIFELYQYLLVLYDEIDTNYIDIYNSDMVISTLYENVNDFVYATRTNIIHLIPGFQPEYIIGNPNNPKIIQPNYLSENYQIFNIFYENNQKTILPISVNSYPTLTYFESLLTGNLKRELFLNLNLYLSTRRYILNLSLNRQIVRDYENIKNIQNNILPFLSTQLISDVSQFIQILKIVQEFKHINRFTANQNMLMYGLFFTNNSTNNNNSDYNNFFYDQNYIQTSKTAYYINWVKTVVSGFFSELKILFNNYTSYYTNESYWYYFNLYDTEPNSTHLSSILNVNGNIILEDINENIQANGIFKRIWFFEFTPFIVLKNLYDLFNTDNGTFWKPSFSTGGQISLNQYNEYFNMLLETYYWNNTYQLGYNIYDYLVNVNYIGYFLAYVFLPYTTYTKQDVISRLLIKYPDGSENLKIISGIYLDLYQDLDTSSMKDIPNVLFPLDVLLLEMGMDILNVIDFSSSTFKYYIKLDVVKILRLFILSSNHIPLESDPIINPNYYIFRLESKIYVNDIINHDTNKIARISSIWNNITRTQMTNYNNLYRNKLLSTLYYRIFPIQYREISPNNIEIVTTVSNLGHNESIGYTLQQSYEIFVSYFFNKRILTPPYQVQSTPLEYIIDNTSFYNLNLNPSQEPIDYLEEAITMIILEIKNKIQDVETKLYTRRELLGIKNINVDNGKYYFNTLYNILNETVNNIKFNIFSETDVTTTNVTSVNSSSLVSKIYDDYDDKVNQIIGNTFVDLKIVPMQENMNLSCGQTYISMYDPIPRKTIFPKTKIYRSFLDFISQIKLSITSASTVSYYEHILSLCGIYLASISDEAHNIIINDIQTGIEAEPDIKYETFLSPENNPGNLIANSSLNPPGFQNTDIVANYNSLQSPLDIIRFLLDLIIQDLIQTNPIFELGKDDRFLDYLIEIQTKYKNYINKLTYFGKYENSEIDLLIRELIWDFKDDESTKPAKFAWANYIAYALIDEVVLKIGGMKIDSFNRDWLYVNYMSTRDINHEISNNEMLGNVPELITYNNNQKSKTKLYLPLDFWFCKNFNESLPMICLNYTQVTLSVRLKDLEQVAYWPKKYTYFKNPLRLRSYLYVDYIYLTHDERLRFANTKHEYLIETVSYTNKILKREIDINQENTVKQRLYFHNMCKAIFWIVQFHFIESTEENKRRNILNWNQYRTDFGLDIIDIDDGIESFEIQLDERQREHQRHPQVYNQVIPYYRYYSSFDKGIYLYSFALFPRLLQPSGAINLDKINFVNINMKFSDKIAKAIQAGILSYSWQFFFKTTNILRIMSGMAGLAFVGTQGI